MEIQKLREKRFYFSILAIITGLFGIFEGVRGVIQILKGGQDSISLYCPIFILLALVFHLAAANYDARIQTFLLFRKLEDSRVPSLD